MRTIKRLCYLFLFLLCLNAVSGIGLSSAVAQNQTIDATLTPQKPLSIDTEISKEQRRLEHLQSLLDEQSSLPKLSKLIQHAPVTATNIADKTLALSAETISAQQITAVVQLQEDIEQAIKKHQVYLSDLNNEQEQLEDIGEQLIAQQQLLSNPVNQDKVSESNQQLLPELLNTVNNTLKPSFQQAIEQEENQIHQAKETVSLLKNWQNNLTRILDAPKNTANSRENINQQKKALETEISQLTTELSRQREQLNLADIEKLQIQIYQKRSYLWLLSIDTDLLQLMATVPTTAPDNDSHSLNNKERLETSFSAIQSAQVRIENWENAVKTRQAELTKYTEVIGSQAELEQAYNKRLQTLGFQRLQLNQLLQQFEYQLSTQSQVALFAREALLPETSFSQTLSDVGNALVQVAFQIQISFKSLYRQILQNPWYILLIALTALLVTYFIVRVLNRWVTRTSLKRGADIGIIATLRKLFYAIRKQAYSLVFLVFVLALVRFSDTPSPSDSIICTLVYTLMGLILWWEMTAIEVRLGTITQHFARRGNRVAILLAVLILLYTLSKLSAVSPYIVSLYDKTLMLGMIAFVWVMQKNITRYLKGEQKHINNKAYRLYHTLIKILPKVIIAVCVLGVLGFSHLAWLILGYIAIVMLYFMTLAVGILLINILRKKLKLASIKRFEHGAFIAQDIINPLSTLSKGFWGLFCTALLFLSIGVYNGSAFVLIRFIKWLDTPLFSLGSNAISPFSVLLLIASPFILFRTAKWLRTFSYHWLFSGISDLGIRNSLSIFSQYVAALVGVLITLKIVGIDLTSLAVFAGALGVGVGLGLQDIAKNFISGILLLIERPLRSGDWVAIDGSEGTVKSIGMRAITIETFDNQEVIIPNGNAIGNSFTNYTHSNSLIRTVLYVGAGYSCDPAKVMKILEDILDKTQGVLKDPESKVVMWEYADSSINYRIQYYIDMDNSGLLEVKTAIFKAIWYDFKANDIEIPFPQRDIHFRNLLQSETPAISDKQSDDKVV